MPRPDSHLLSTPPPLVPPSPRALCLSFPVDPAHTLLCAWTGLPGSKCSTLPEALSSFPVLTSLKPGGGDNAPVSQMKNLRDEMSIQGYHS